MVTAKSKALSEKFDIHFRREMRSRLVELDDEVEIFMLALLAKTHACFVGDPGIAKSLMVETGVSLIGDLDPNIDYFHTLMMRSTTPEAIFGPLKLSLLKEDRYVFKSEGFLPDAKIANLEEMWKANAAILNALLWATHERLYRNDGKIVKIPLHSMFISSNELPEGDELRAIYDRFPLRRIVQPIQEPGNFIAMLGLTAAPITPVVTWAEVEQAHQEAQKVTIPGDVLEAMADIRSKLKEMSILPSDRRFKIALDIVRAKAWLDGATEAEIQHLRPLRHVLWTEVEHIKEVDKLMLGFSNPIDKEIGEVLAGLADVSIDVERTISDGGDRDQMRRAGTQQFDKVTAAIEELAAIGDRMKNSARREEKLATAKQTVVGLINRILTKVFEMNPEDVEATTVEAFASDPDESDDE